MNKFEIIEKMKNAGFDEDELLSMFIYWLDISEIENCTNDFLNDRDLKFNSYNEIVSSYEEDEEDEEDEGL